jgi:glycosyltransferase EpsE
MMKPRVSVLIGLYNCASTVEESLDSVACQTYTDWEMLLCDDGSTDNTLQVARDWAKREPRARVLANDRNLGLARTLDRCIAESHGELLARQDGDDISAPDRFAKLVGALDTHPEIAVVSSWMSCFDQNGVWGMVRTSPFPEPRDFLRGSPVCHAPCMMRRAPVLAVGGYGAQPWILQVEDLFLWFRLYSAGHKAINLQEPLYRMRDDENARNRRTLARRFNETRVRWKGFGMLGLPWHKRLWAVRPILVWALPSGVYRRLHAKRLK